MITRAVNNILSVRNINLLLRYIYLFIFLLGLMLIYTAFKNNKGNKRIRVKNKKKVRSNKRNIFLEKVINHISDSLSFTNSYSKKTNDKLALLFIIVYTVLVLIIYRYLNAFAFIWYTKSVNLMVAIFLPYAMISTYIGLQLSKINKQIPNAFYEIASAYRNDRRIRVAINEALPYMDRHIRKEYKRLNSYLSSAGTFDYGLEYFSRRMNNNYITLFCTIIKESRYMNSDLTEPLTKLAIKARSKNYMKEKAKRELVWFRVLLILWLFSIPAIMKFVSKLSMDAYRYYNTVEGAKIVTLTMLSIVISYLIILMMEKN